MFNRHSRSINRYPHTGRTSRPAAIIIVCIFLSIGLAGLTWIVFIPVYQTILARSWQPVTCEIVTSRVESHSRRTYSIDIQYEYEYGGTRYSSNRYNFITGSSSGKAAKQLVIAKYPPGSMQTCFVNPKSPQQSVLSRGLSADIAFGLIPLAFFIIGAICLWSMFMSQKHEQLLSAAIAVRSPDATPESMTAAQMDLDELPQSERALLDRKTNWLVASILAFAVMSWNGIVYGLWLLRLIASWSYKPNLGTVLESVFFVAFAVLGIHIAIKAIAFCIKFWRTDSAIT